MFPQRENPKGKEAVDQQLFDILHPSKFRQNFGVLSSFENYLRGFCASYDRIILAPTFKKVLKEYELWEGYEQCEILKNIINELKK